MSQIPTLPKRCLRISRFFTAANVRQLTFLPLILCMMFISGDPTLPNTDALPANNLSADTQKRSVVEVFYTISGHLEFSKSGKLILAISNIDALQFISQFPLLESTEVEIGFDKEYQIKPYSDKLQGIIKKIQTYLATKKTTVKRIYIASSSLYQMEIPVPKIK